MESALDVLSRAATMVQDNANETRLTSKELPTTAWRRERRSRAGEYHHPQPCQPGLSENCPRASPPSLSPPPNVHVQLSHNSSGSVPNTNSNMCSNAHHISLMMAAAASVRPLSESTSNPQSSPPHSNLASHIHLGQISSSQFLEHINSIQHDDAPLDMSVGNLKQRNSPPPPYREPLPGSQFASSLARPSVITQAPPKRDIRETTLAANRGESDNRSCESIDEHFRRSLGNDYFSLFSKRSPASQSKKTPSPQPQSLPPSTTLFRSSSPILPLSSRVSTLPSQSTLPQPGLTPSSAYSINVAAGNQQNSHQAHQTHILARHKTNNALLSSAATTAQMKIATRHNSPPLPLVIRSNILQNHQPNLVLQKSSSLISITAAKSPQSLPSTKSGKRGNTIQTPTFNTSGSRIAAPLPLQQQSSAVAVTVPNLACNDNSPSHSPRHTPLNVTVPNPSPNLPAIMRIKTEPGLESIKLNNATPPASPTSTTNHNMANYTYNCSNISSPPSPTNSSWNPFTNVNNTSAEVLASVDDHFAKALGDTWKKLQENNEIRK